MSLRLNNYVIGRLVNRICHVYCSIQLCTILVSFFSIAYI
jgi:hypothetical protein